MERINIEEVVDKLDMFQYTFGKIYWFGWWKFKMFLVDAGTQFTSTEFQYKYQTHGVHIK